jgi:hypothetical protein
MSDPVSDLKHELLAAAERQRGTLLCTPVVAAWEGIRGETACS